jgi:hypothetical protein
MPNQRKEFDNDAFRILNEAIRLFKGIMEEKGFVHYCRSDYEERFIKSLGFYRDCMQEEMIDRATRDLDAHKVATLIMLAILDSRPLYTNGTPKPKVSWLANEILAYLAMKNIIRNQQILDVVPPEDVERCVSSILASAPMFCLPEEIYERKESVLTFNNLLFRLSQIHPSNTSHRNRLKVFMMPLAFIIFLFDCHNRPMLMKYIKSNIQE